jgi:hypothetical protein
MSEKHSNLGELIMRTWSRNGAAVAVLFGLMWVVVSAAALADVKDYEFQLVQSEIKKGDGAIVAVRLVNKKSGKPVSDAIIFAKRIDMAPDAMQEMTAPLEQLPPTEPGVYRFKTDLTMQGRWRLSLGAKVQGEEGTVACPRSLDSPLIPEPEPLVVVVLPPRLNHPPITALSSSPLSSSLSSRTLRLALELCIVVLLMIFSITG